MERHHLGRHETREQGTCECCREPSSGIGGHANSSSERVAIAPSSTIHIALQKFASPETISTNPLSVLSATSPTVPKGRHSNPLRLTFNLDFGTHRRSLQLHYNAQCRSRNTQGTFWVRFQLDDEECLDLFRVQSTALGSRSSIERRTWGTGSFVSVKFVTVVESTGI